MRQNGYGREAYLVLLVSIVKNLFVKNIFAGQECLLVKNIADYYLFRLSSLHVSLVSCANYLFRLHLESGLEQIK